jgi:hypothetical protein
LYGYSPDTWDAFTKKRLVSYKLEFLEVWFNYSREDRPFDRFKSRVPNTCMSGRILGFGGEYTNDKRQQNI